MSELAKKALAEYDCGTKGCDDSRFAQHVLAGAAHYIPKLCEEIRLLESEIDDANSALASLMSQCRTDPEADRDELDWAFQQGRREGHAEAQDERRET